MLTEEELSQELGWNPGTEQFEYLSLGSDPLPGMPTELHLNWIEEDENQPGVFVEQQVSVGVFIPTYAGCAPADRGSRGRIRFTQGVPDLTGVVDIPTECEPELICGMWCPQWDLHYRKSSASGLIQMHDGTSMYVMGTQMELTTVLLESDQESESRRLFVARMTASSIPVIQDATTSLPWLGNRNRAEQGEIPETPEEIDLLFESNHRQETRPEVPLTERHPCWISCLNELERDQESIDADYKDHIRDCESLNDKLNLGTGAFIGTVMTCSASGAGIGVCVGGVGAVPGLISGCILGLVIASAAECLDTDPDTTASLYLTCHLDAQKDKQDRKDSADKRFKRCCRGCNFKHPEALEDSLDSSG